MKKLIIVFSVLMFVSDVSAESNKLDILKIRGFRCTFHGGYSAMFEGLKPKTEQYSLKQGDRGSEPLFIQEIDYQKQTARIASSNGMGVVGAYTSASPAGVFFLDHPALGGMNTFFIYATPNHTGEYVIVQTQNIEMLKFVNDTKLVKIPVAAQDYGTCFQWR